MDDHKLLKYIKKNGYIQTKSLCFDIVFTWVNSEDPIWIKKFKDYKKSIYNEVDNQFENRFVNYNELYFSLNSINKFLNFVTKIYIIVDNQLIDFKKINKELHNKIKLINHQDIIPHHLLPVFNSELIQPFIYNIKELNENVLIFDDDFFIGNYIDINDIFDIKYNVIKTYWIYRKVFDSYFTEFRLKNNNALISTYKTFKVFKKKFRFYPDLQNPHIVLFTTKSTLQKTFKIFKSDLEKTFKYKLRSPYNLKFLNLAGYVGIYYGYMKLIDIRSASYKTYLYETVEQAYVETKDIIEKKPKFYTINRINKSTYPFFDLLSKNYFKLF